MSLHAIGKCAWLPCTAVHVHGSDYRCSLDAVLEKETGPLCSISKELKTDFNPKWLTHS